MVKCQMKFRVKVVFFARSPSLRLYHRLASRKRSRHRFIAERLYAQRLLDLEGGKLGGGFIHVRIDERTDARGQRIATGKRDICPIN